MFNCKKLFKLQVRPPSSILLTTASQDRWIFPSQSWEVKNSIIIIIIIIKFCVSYNYLMKYLLFVDYKTLRLNFFSFRCPDYCLSFCVDKYEKNFPWKRFGPPLSSLIFLSEGPNFSRELKLDWTQSWRIAFIRVFLARCLLISYDLNVWLFG